MGPRYWQQQVPGISAVFVRRPRVIVFDILGTASKSGFLERILFPYLRINLEPYLNTHWGRKDFLKLYKRIQDQSVELASSSPGVPQVLQHDRPDAKQSLIQFINYVTDQSIPSAPVTQLRFKVWFEGYQSMRLRTPIYSDVPARMRAWFAEGIKFNVFSNTWVEAQRALLKNTNHGDLTNLISGHFDNDFGLLTTSDSWRRLCSQINEQPNDVLFLTKSPQEAAAAQEAGICVVLVLTHRHNVRAVSHDDRQRFPYVRTLNDLRWLESSMMPTGGGGAGASNVETQRTQLTTSGTSASGQPSAGSAAVAGPSGHLQDASASGHSSTRQHSQNTQTIASSGAPSVSAPGASKHHSQNPPPSQG